MPCLWVSEDAILFVYEVIQRGCIIVFEDYHVSFLGAFVIHLLVFWYGFVDCSSKYCIVNFWASFLACFALLAKFLFMYCTGKGGFGVLV